MKVLFAPFLIIFSGLIKFIDSKGDLKVLDESSWSDMLEGEWMVKFYAPWCPACQQVKPTWEEFAKWSDDLGIKVGSVDVTLNPGLSGRFMITALPTIFHVKDGVFRQYRGSRDKDSFFSFVEEKKWQSLEAVSSWKSPQSFQMSFVAYVFKLSMVLRSLHNTLQDYGVPYWGSYIIFGLATILLGSLLGLMIVCCLDFICIARGSRGQPSPKDPNFESKKEEKKREEEEYEEEDVIRDDSTEDTALRRRKETADQ